MTALTLFATVLTGQAPNDLGLRLRKDDRWVVQRTIRFTNDAEEIDLSSVERFSYHIREATTSGYVVRVEKTLVETRAGEHRIPSDPSQNVERWDERLSPTGVPSPARESGDAGTVRLSRLSEIRHGGPGQLEWSWDFPPLDKGLAPAMHVIGKRLGPESAQVRYGLTYREAGPNPVTGSGVATVDPATGLAISLDMKARNVPLPYGEIRCDVVIQSRLQP